MLHKKARQTLSQREQAVTSAAAKVSLTTGMAGKEYMMVANIGSSVCYIGDSSVSSTNGYPLFPRAAYDWGHCTPNFNFYVVSAGTATTTLGIYET